jgi:hypothetical protein
MPSQLGTVEIPVTPSDAEWLRLGGVELGTEGRVVVLEGRPVALDLRGATVEEALELLDRHPRAAVSMRGSMDVLCHPDVRLRVAAIRPPAAWLGIDGRGFAAGELPGCIDDLAVEQLHLDLPGAGDELLAALASRPYIRGLGLVGAQATSAGLAELSALGDLLWLDLTGSAVRDRDLRHLPAALRRLDLGRTEVGDEGLAHVSRLTALRRLSLVRTATTDRGVASLAPLRMLRVLDLRHTAVTDAAAPHLAALDGLRVLRLDHTEMTDAAVSHLTTLRALDTLGLRATAVTGAGIEKLRGALPGARITSP